MILANSFDSNSNYINLTNYMKFFHYYFEYKSLSPLTFMTQQIHDLTSQLSINTDDMNTATIHDVAGFLYDEFFLKKKKLFNIYLFLIHLKMLFLKKFEFIIFKNLIERISFKLIFN